MEYVEKGDLRGYLRRRPALPERDVKEIAFQILDGLNMMHDKKFAHRDLKPEVSPFCRTPKHRLTQYRISSYNLSHLMNGGSRYRILASANALAKIPALPQLCREPQDT